MLLWFKWQAVRLGDGGREGREGGKGTGELRCPLGWRASCFPGIERGGEGRRGEGINEKGGEIKERGRDQGKGRK